MSIEPFDTKARRDTAAIPEYAVAVTKSDSDDLVTISLGLYVGTGGDVKVTTKRGNTVTYKNVASGSTISGRFTRVWSTGTTAADILALY